MARYKVGNGPLCHTCVPVSLCFAGADFSKNIVNILWFSCFTCVLNATSGIGFFCYMLAVSFDVTIYGIKCTFLPVVLYVLWVLFRCCMFFAQYALCVVFVKCALVPSQCNSALCAFCASHFCCCCKFKISFLRKRVLIHIPFPLQNIHIWIN